MLFSPLSEAIVLFAVPAVFWHVMLLQRPLGLVPVFLVPYAVVAHILSLVQLRKDRLAAAVG